MSADALITLIVILIAIVFFATELLSVDLVAILVMVALILTVVITPEEGVEGFSNEATITVSFMFVLSFALLKTGVLQFLAFMLSGVFKRRPNGGLLLTMLMIATISAFMNNTPVVAVFIPVVLQIAQASGQNPQKMLIPLSFAASASFMTPIGYQTNTMVYIAGQYRFADFLKVGTFLNLVFRILATSLMPMIYPF